MSTELPSPAVRVPVDRSSPLWRSLLGKAFDAKYLGKGWLCPANSKNLVFFYLDERRTATGNSAIVVWTNAIRRSSQVAQSRISHTTISNCLTIIMTAPDCQLRYSPST